MKDLGERVTEVHEFTELLKRHFFRNFAHVLKHVLRFVNIHSNINNSNIHFPELLAKAASNYFALSLKTTMKMVCLQEIMKLWFQNEIKYFN